MLLNNIGFMQNDGNEPFVDQTNKGDIERCLGPEGKPLVEVAHDLLRAPERKEIESEEYRLLIKLCLKSTPTELENRRSG